MCSAFIVTYHAKNDFGQKIAKFYNKLKQSLVQSLCENNCMVFKTPKNAQKW